MKLIKLEDALSLFEGDDTCGLKNSAARRKLNELPSLTNHDIELITSCVRATIDQVKEHEFQDMKLLYDLYEIHNKLWMMNRYQFDAERVKQVATLD